MLCFCLNRSEKTIEEAFETFRQKENELEERSKKVPCLFNHPVSLRSQPLLGGARQYSCVSDLCRFVDRRYSAAAHSPGVGVGFREDDLQKSPHLKPLPHYVRHFLLKCGVLKFRQNRYFSIKNSGGGLEKKLEMRRIQIMNFISIVL